MVRTIIRRFLDQQPKVGLERAEPRANKGHMFESCIARTEGPGSVSEIPDGFGVFACPAISVHVLSTPESTASRWSRWIPIR
jgi:hypothetical protein